jgi:hypothetical protein
MKTASPFSLSFGIARSPCSLRKTSFDFFAYLDKDALPNLIFDSARGGYYVIDAAAQTAGADCLRLCTGAVWTSPGISGLPPLNATAPFGR